MFAVSGRDDIVYTKGVLNSLKKMFSLSLPVYFFFAVGVDKQGRFSDIFFNQ